MTVRCQSVTRQGRPCSLPEKTIIKIDFFGQEVLLAVCAHHARAWKANSRYRGLATEKDLEAHQARQYSPEWAQASRPKV